MIEIVLAFEDIDGKEADDIADALIAFAHEELGYMVSDHEVRT